MKFSSGGRAAPPDELTYPNGADHIMTNVSLIFQWCGGHRDNVSSNPFLALFQRDLSAEKWAAVRHLVGRNLDRTTDRCLPGFHHVLRFLFF